MKEEYRGYTIEFDTENVKIWNTKGELVLDEKYTLNYDFVLNVSKAWVDVDIGENIDKMKMAVKDLENDINNSLM